jgi:hypothetical protein
MKTRIGLLEQDKTARSEQPEKERGKSAARAG